MQPGATKSILRLPYWVCRETVSEPYLLILRLECDNSIECIEDFETKLLLGARDVRSVFPSFATLGGKITWIANTKFESRELRKLSTRDLVTTWHTWHSLVLTPIRSGFSLTLQNIVSTLMEMASSRSLAKCAYALRGQG